MQMFLGLVLPKATTILKFIQEEPRFSAKDVIQYLNEKNI